MKKIYMTPQMDVVKIETQGMLALSGGLDITDEIVDPEVFGAPEFVMESDDMVLFDESSVDYDNF